MSSQLVIGIQNFSLDSITTKGKQNRSYHGFGVMMSFEGHTEKFCHRVIGITENIIDPWVRRLALQCSQAKEFFI
jgi:hypothetical protein